MIDVEKVEIFDNNIDLYLQQFIKEQNIENMKTESQSVWNACMMYIRKHVFPDKRTLKGCSLIGNAPQNCNAYDYELINELVDHYVYLCGMFDKEVSIMGFAKLTGIDNDTIYQWGFEERVSPFGLIVYKKLMKEREESLSAKLATGNKNPVGILAILNKHYQWNLPGVSKEPAKKALSISELPQLPDAKDIIDG